MFHKKSYILIGFLLAFCGSIKCDTNELDSDKIKDGLKDGFKDVNLENIKNIDVNQIDLNEIRSKLPAGVTIPEGFDIKNATNAINEAKRLFKEKCAKVSGNDTAYERIESSIEHLMQCATDLINVEELRDEIEKAQPTGELDIVFNKYCRKRDTAIGCMENFTDVVKPCLDPAEIEGQNSFVKVVKNLLNFICHKDGDQIALFIAEKGPECFEERKDDLITCINNTFYKYLPSEKEIDDKTVVLPKFVIGAEQCNDMTKLQRCVVTSLERCSESTPGNLVDSMFKFVRRETPCVNLTQPENAALKPNGGYIHLISSNLFLMVLVLFISKFFSST